MSQSPKSGLFNSDRQAGTAIVNVFDCLNPLSRVYSILINVFDSELSLKAFGLNPLSRVYSILMVKELTTKKGEVYLSQSPKSGLFNSDNSQKTTAIINVFESQSPKSGLFNSDTGKEI